LAEKERVSPEALMKEASLKADFIRWQITIGLIE